MKNIILTTLVLAFSPAAFADELPSDLKSFWAAKKKLTAVSDSEMRLEIDIRQDNELTLANALTTIANAEKEVFAEREGLINFGVEEITGRNVSDKVIRDIQPARDGYAGYFCINFLGLSDNFDGTDEYSQLCTEKTQQLLAGLSSKKHRIYLVSVNGDDAGDYEYKVLYIQSKEDPTVTIRYLFDIIHEI